MAGVEEHAVALADLFDSGVLNHLLDVIGRNDARAVGGGRNRQRVGAAQLGRIEQHAAADKALLADILHPEVAHAQDHVAGAALVGGLALAAVVEQVALRRAHANVARTVELGADLADLGGDQLVVEDQTVAAERPAGGRARNLEQKATRTEERNVARIVFAERRGLALLHQLDRFEHHLGRGPIGRAHLVVRAPFARPPVLLKRLVIELLGGGAERETDAQPTCRPGHRRSFHDRHRTPSLLGSGAVDPRPCHGTQLIPPAIDSGKVPIQRSAAVSTGFALAGRPIAGATFATAASSGSL